MLHKLDWLHQLNITYDASTFDTDPFEPQPEGRHTIFPFWVPQAGANGESPVTNPSRGRSGYVELPYTLPQDSTLFLLLRETTPEIWMRKLDWIAEHGGMALIDTHPDYMALDGSSQKAGTYPLRLYRDFLDYIRSTYSGEYWAALPRQVAAHLLESTVLGQNRARLNSNKA
jgi:hypothetical protein